MQRVLLILVFIIGVMALAGEIITGRQRQLPPINADTVADLQLAERFGNGTMNDAIAFSPVNERVVVGGSRGLYFYDTIDAEPEFIPLFRADGVPMDVTSVLWSADSEWVFAGTDEEYLEPTFVDYEEIIAYDITSHEIIYRLDGNTPHDISDDGSMLTYEMETGIHIVDVQTGALIHEITDETLGLTKYQAFSQTTIYGDWRIWGLHFVNEDRQVCTGHNSWMVDTSSGSHTILIDFTSEDAPYFYYTDTCDPDAFIGATNYDYTAGGFVVYEGEEREEQITTLFADDYEPLAGVDNRILNYTYDNYVRLLALPSMQEISTLSIPRQDIIEINQLANGDLLVSRTLDEPDQYAIHLLSAETGLSLNEITYHFVDSRRPYSARDGYVFADDSPYAVTLGENYRLWHLELGIEIDLPDNTQLIAPYFLPDNRVVLWNDIESEVWLYDYTTEDYTFVPMESDITEDRYSDRVSYAFSDDGSIFIFSEPVDESPITVWDIRNNPPQLLLSAPAGNYPPEDVAVSPDGSLVAFGNTNRQVEVRNLEDGTTHIMERHSSSSFDWIIFDRHELIVKPNYHGSYWIEVFNIETGDFLGEYVDYPIEHLLLNADGMSFYRYNRTVLRIDATDGLTLHEIDLERVATSLTLSEGTQRLWVNLSDGVLELWTVGQ